MNVATVSGALGNQTVNVALSSQLQAAFVQQIISAASSLSSFPQSIGSGATGTIALTSAIAVDTATTPHIVNGSADVPEVQVVLAGSNGAYVTGGTRLSTVIAADNSNSAIVNTNRAGGLVAITGAGPNALGGFAGVNQFVTGVNGQDVVIMNGTNNNLTSGGSDAVLVGGPSTITAAPGGADNVAMTAGTSLVFINTSERASTITGTAGASVVVTGTGSTLVAAGAGAESFTVDTTAGNVTLAGSSAGTDTFTFVHGAATALGTGNEVVTGFTANDTVQLRGYAGYSIQADQNNPQGSVLSLSDGSKVTFSDASAATVQAHLKVS